MNNHKIILGKWWISDNPSRKIVGVLDIDKKELFLSDSLNGDDFDKYFSGKISEPRFLQPNDSIFINGIDMRNNQGIYNLVFYDNPKMCKQRLTVMDATYCYSYRISQIWQGVFLNNFGDLKSNQFIYDIHGLPQFIPTAKLKINKNRKKISLCLPDDIKIYSTSNTCIYLHNSVNYRPQAISSEYKFKNCIGLRITSRRKLPLSKSTEYCRKIVNFFSIITTTKLTTGMITLKCNHDYCHTIVDEDYTPKINKPLCGYITLRDELSQLLSKWLSLYDQYHVVFDQLSIFAGEKLPVETRFIIYAEIIETYVGIKSLNPGNNFQSSLEYLDKSLDKSMRIFNKSHKNKIRTTRNKLVHGKLDKEISQEKIITDVHELLVVGKLMEYLVMVDIFKTIGANESIVNEIRNYYKFYINIFQLTYNRTSQ